jgi:hypothetical protein
MVSEHTMTDSNGRCRPKARMRSSSTTSLEGLPAPRTLAIGARSPILSETATGRTTGLYDSLVPYLIDDNSETTPLHTHHNLGSRMAYSIPTIDSVGEHGVPLLAILTTH